MAWINPFMPTVAFNICCPRDCVYRHNGDTSDAPLNPSETIVLSEHYRFWGVQGGHPRFPHYAERRQSLGQQMLELGCENAMVGENGLMLNA